MDLWAATTGAVRFPDGRVVRGTGIRHRRGETPNPDFAVYLLGRDPVVTGWRSRWVRWRDFGLPASTEQCLDALGEAHLRATSERVEIACSGGIGRTGTALAVLAIMSGVAPADAVEWVRSTYHQRAVETRRQRAWVSSVAPLLV